MSVLNGALVVNEFGIEVEMMHSVGIGSWDIVTVTVSV